MSENPTGRVLFISAVRTGWSSGGCACSAIYVKPFGTSRIRGHSAGINDCCSEVSTSCCQSKKCKAMAAQGWTSGNAANGAAGKCWGNFSCCRVWPGLCVLCHRVLHIRYNSKPHFYTYDILYYLKLVWRQPKYIHKMAMKSLSPSVPNNAREVFGPSVLIFLTGEALSISEIV